MSTSLIALVKFIGTTLLYLITGVISMAAGTLLLMSTKFGRKCIKNTILLIISLLNNTKFGNKIVEKFVEEGKE